MTRFEKLDAWKRSAALCVNIYREFSELRDFGFRDQITRSGLSISSNIAEGFERGSQKETANFLNYAKGSAGELRSQIYVGIKVGYIKNETGKAWLKEASEISKMIYALMKSVRKNELFSTLSMPLSLYRLVSLKPKMDSNHTGCLISRSYSLAKSLEPRLMRSTNKSLRDWKQHLATLQKVTQFLGFSGSKAACIKKIQMTHLRLQLLVAVAK